jgi:hypothetical protein
VYRPSYWSIQTILLECTDDHGGPSSFDLRKIYVSYDFILHNNNKPKFLCFEKDLRKQHGESQGDICLCIAAMGGLGQRTYVVGVLFVFDKL